VIFRLLISILFLIACAEQAEQPDNVDSEPELVQPIDTIPYVTIVDSVIQRGDTFGKLMLGHLPDSSIFALYDESKSSFALNRIRVGQPYKIQYSDSSFYRFEYEIDSKGIYEIVKVDSNTFESGVRLYQFEIDTVFASGSIQTTLLESITEQKFSELLAYEIANVFAWDIDFVYDIRVGDHYQVYFERLYHRGQRAGVGKILAANFYNQGTLHSAYLFNYPDSINHTEMFDVDGNNVKKAYLKAPVDFSRVSSGFSGKRFHPILKRYKSHFGTDYVADRNTPIFAVADGKVMSAKFRKYNGNYVHLRHAGGYESKYLHMNKIKKGLKVGQSVKQGDVIGYVGKTGLATGYHVCFRFYRHGSPFNFQKLINPKSKHIEAEYDSLFQITKQQYIFPKPPTK
jgi:murein DD-endopeptidase MepM/ murein hydrolase activator NlpD